MKFNFINNKRKVLLFASILLVGIASSLWYYTVQVNGLVKLGYTQNYAKKIVNPTSIYNIVTNNKTQLYSSINNQKNELSELGLDGNTINSVITSSNTLVEKNNSLVEYKTKYITTISTKLNKAKQNASSLNIKYDLSDNNIYKNLVYLNKLIDTKATSMIKKYQSFLLKNGYSKNDMKKLNASTKYQTYLNYQKLVTTQQKKQKANIDFATTELKNQAMRMFNETNKYRVSKGLKPYKYNFKMQSCVFKEAKAYSINKKPHNWLCTAAANENAGLASIKSDYVKVAMDFFKSDPPHEAVLSGNYNSVAIAFVEKDGMVYMIMDVFY